ncbi:MAG: permease, partial [Pirellulales bacterium]|nr:permease [Pirellulales bacterium]
IHHLDGVDGNFARQKLKEKIGITEQITVSIIGLLAVMGLVCRALGIDEQRLAPDSATKQEIESAPGMRGYDRIVSPQLVGGTLLTGMVALSIVMCYAYYPSPEECFEEIRLIRADTLSGTLSGDTEHAMFWVPRWDEWSRRLEVGAFLRRGKVTPYQRMQGYLIRKKLEALEHELAHDDLDEEYARELVADILATNSRWVRAFVAVPDRSGRLEQSQSGPAN